MQVAGATPAPRRVAPKRARGPVHGRGGIRREYGPAVQRCRRCGWRIYRITRRDEWVHVTEMGGPASGPCEAPLPKPERPWETWIGGTVATFYVAVNVLVLLLIVVGLLWAAATR
jgi:hypothetical protein